MAGKTYIDLLNDFYILIQSGMVSSNAQLLYHTLLMIRNSCGRPEWFARTNRSLSDMMGISTKAVINARNELRKLRVIQIASGKGSRDATKYHLLENYLETQEHHTETIEEPQKNCNGITEEPSKNHIGTIIESQENHRGTMKEPQPSHLYKSKRERERKSKSNIPPISPLDEIRDGYTQNPEVLKAVNGWIEMRRQKKKEPTPHALDLALKKLDRLAGTNREKAAVLDQSTINGWTDLYPLKEPLEPEDPPSPLPPITVTPEMDTERVIIKPGEKVDWRDLVD